MSTNSINFEDITLDTLEFKKDGEYWVTENLVKMPSGRFCHFNFKYDEEDAKIVDWQKIAYQRMIQSLRDWDAQHEKH